MRSNYPKNFDPAIYLGFDGLIPEPESGCTWSKWCAGEDERVPEEVAIFCWVHFVEAIDSFVRWDGSEKYPAEYAELDELAQTQFRKDLTERFDILGHEIGETWKVTPFALETIIPNENNENVTSKDFLQSIFAYSIKCFDDGFSGIFENDAAKSALSFAYAIRAIALGHEYQCNGEGPSKRHFHSNMSRKGAEAKLLKDPKQGEKNFVLECWKEWQKHPERYTSKADFSRDMLNKCEHLKSQPKIEQWCRAWEKDLHTMPEE